MPLVSPAIFLLQGKVRGETILKVCVLASGSSGNATFVAAGRTRILVDAGLSFRELSRRLAEIGEDPKNLDCRPDQSRAQRPRRRTPRPRQALPRPHLPDPSNRPQAIDWNGAVPHVETFQAGSRFSLGDIEVDSFTIPHDAADPVAFAFRAEGVRIGIVTDLGYIPESVKYHLQGTDLLILESNHDLEMLRVGPYPWPVKQRVMGRNGHLSNDDMERFVREDLDSRTAMLVLAHLSENNNFPAQVRLVAEQALASRSLSIKLAIAEQRRSTEVFTL